MSVARWTLLARSPTLARSSHCLSVTSTGRAALYSGELKPRNPVDADENSKGAVHTFDVSQVKPSTEWQTLGANGHSITGRRIPEPRVGAATAVIGQTIYLWGGRGGVDMTAPISGEEAGIWAIDLSDPSKAAWESIKAVNENEAPQPRSYHTMTSLGVSAFRAS